MVLEEYDGDLAQGAAGGDTWPAELFFFSEPSADALAKKVGSLMVAVREGAAPALRDLAFAVCDDATPRRAAGNSELAIIASSLADLSDKLARAHDSVTSDTELVDPRGVFRIRNPVSPTGSTAFLFPGQGSQYPNMLRDLAVHFGVVREAVERADETLAARIPQGLSRFIFPPPVFTPEAESEMRRALTATQIAQPALGAVESGILRLLRELGVEPQMTAGHSYGEYVALHAGGMIDEATLIRLSEARGRIIAECAGEDAGTMAAVGAGDEVVANEIAGLEGVWIANLNAPEQTIIAGTRSGIESATAVLEAKAIGVREIAVSCAFHSPLVADASSRFADELSAVCFNSPKVPVFSNTTAAPYPETIDEIVELLARHIVTPVRFRQQIESMYDAGARIFVEAGPRNVLTGLVRQILGSRPHLAVAIDAPGSTGVAGLLTLLAQLAAHGANINFGRLFEGRSVRRVELTRLVEQTSPKPASATAWLVDPGQARPASMTRVPVGKAPLAEWAATAGLSARSIDSGLLSPSAELDAIPSRALAGIRSATTASQADNVLLEFQRTMTKALEVQEAVMLAYLGSTSGISQHLPAATAVMPVATTAPAAIVADAKSTTGNPSPAATNGDSAPAESALTTGEQVLSRLLQIVSDRTGYPTEMLGLDVDLEGDLGIDSIKRTEIVGALRKSVANRKTAPRTMDSLTKAKTLRAIADVLLTSFVPAPDPITEVERLDPFVGQQNAPSEGASSPLPATIGDAPSASRRELTRSALRAVLAPLLAEPTHDVPSDGVFLITDDGNGISHAVAAGITERGGNAAVMLSGNIEDGLARLRAQHGAIRGVIHLAPLRDGPAAGMDSSDAWSMRLSRETKMLFGLLRSAGEEIRARASSKVAGVIAATSLDGHWALDGGEAHAESVGFFPGSGALAGLIKTVAIEWPEVPCRVIDFARTEARDAIARQVLDELMISGVEVQIGYAGPQRFAVRHVTTPLQRNAVNGKQPTDAPTSTFRMNRDSVILATGGACGITAEILLDLARSASGGHFIVTGRSAVPAEKEAPDTRGLINASAIKGALLTRLRVGGAHPPIAAVERAYRELMREREIRRNLDRIRSTGATAVYRQTDASNPAAILELVDSVHGELGRIDGVIHAAGIIDDRLIEDKTQASFDSVFDVKANGAFALARALESRQPGFIAFFSSVAAAFGNRGQSDYAAANELLNKLAAYLDARWTTRVFAIGWGPWKGAGMVSPELAEQLAEQRRPLIEINQGTVAFRRELLEGSKGATQVLFTGDTTPVVDSIVVQGASADGYGGLTGFKLASPLADGADQQHRVVTPAV